MAFPPGLLTVLATDLVNEVTQLNNNWDAIDAAFTSLYQTGATPFVSSPVDGMEWINNSGKYMARVAGVWIEPEIETWPAWTNLTMVSPYVADPTYPPQVRISSHNNVHMRGRVLAATGGGPFPNAGTYQQACSFAGTTYIPGQFSAFTAAMQIAATGVGPNGGINIPSGGANLVVNVVAQGDRTASSYLCLDQVRYSK